MLPPHRRRTAFDDGRPHERGDMKGKLARFKEKDTRKLFGAILGGKMIAILLLFGAMIGFNMLFGGSASAQTAAAPQHTANELINPVNTVWVLVTAFLVFF